MNSLKDTLVCVNGVFTPPEEARVSIFDRGFLYGDSIYEVTLTYEGIPFLLEDHFDRLEHSAAGIFMDVEWDRNQIIKYLYEGIQRLKSDRLYIRIIVTRGGGEIGLDPNLSDGQNLFIIFRPLSNYPQEWYEKGVSLIITEVVRNAKKAVDPNVKSGNYLNNVMAISQAKKKGAYDAIMLNADGYVTECTSANIWMVHEGTFFTPPLEAGLLGGITRKSLLQIGKEQGLNIVEKDLMPEDLRSASEIFMTSSTREILPVTTLDGQPVGNGLPGPLTQDLHTRYKSFVREEIAKEKKKAQSLGLLT